MANLFDMLDRLSTRARKDGEYHPVEVTPEVLKRLRHEDTSTERPLILFTLGSCAVAFVVLILGVNVFEKISDPLLVMLWMIPAIYF